MFLYSLNFLFHHLGNVYIADSSNSRIRKVTISTGIITTFAGTGTNSYSGDAGAATSATLINPYGVALDSAGTYSLRTLTSFTVLPLFLLLYVGNVYIADSGNHRVRKVTISTGIITTIAGIGTGSYSGDNGPATSAGLNIPSKVAFDSAGTHSLLLVQSTSFPNPSFSLGNVYIADYLNNRIRKVTMSTVTTTPRYQSIQIYLSSLYILLYLLLTYLLNSSTSTSPTLVPSTSTPTTSTPSSNYPSLSPSTVFTISTIAGSGTSGSFSGDNGQATSAGLDSPQGVCVDAAGEHFYTN